MVSRHRWPELGVTRKEKVLRETERVDGRRDSMFCALCPTAEVAAIMQVFCVRSVQHDACSPPEKEASLCQAPLHLWEKPSVVLK